MLGSNLKSLNFLDYFVFFLILGITFYAVWWGNHRKKLKKQTSIIDHLLMGRMLTLPMFIATLVATWYGGIFGVTEIAFNNGIYNLITQGVFWYVSYLIFALFLLPKVYSKESVTLPNLIENTIGPRSAKLSSLFNFINILPISYTIGLGLFLKTLFNLDLSISMLLGLAVVLSYSFKGGFRSVVFSDMVQFFVMCFSVAFVLIFSIINFGSWDYLTSHLPESYFSPFGNQPLLEVFAWGLIALSTLVDPNFYQRCFAASSEKVARKGILTSTLIWFLFDICTTFGAMYAKAAMPQADSSGAYLAYSLDLLPNGLKGFFLAGILATVLSTLDSYLFLSGTTFSYDILKKRNQNGIKFHRIGLVCSGLLAYILALTFEGNIKAVWKSLGGLSASCLLFPVLFSQFSNRKPSDKQFFFACILSAITVCSWPLMKKPLGLEIIDSLYVGVLVSFSCLTLFKFKNLSSQR
ncbi:MAG: sodium:solute symporter family protein [Bacteriovoracaceae bacterium]